MASRMGWANSVTQAGWVAVGLGVEEGHKVGVEVIVEVKVKVEVRVGVDVLVGVGACPKERTANMLPPIIATPSRMPQIQRLFLFSPLGCLVGSAVVG
jgi:hypothetical protein